MAAAGRCVAYSPERRGRMAELEAEFAARQREMERMQINDGATGAGDAGEQGAQEAAVPKQLSGTELLMQRLAAMGALDENSAPPDGISAAGAPAANGPREASAKATGDGANGKIPAPSPTGKKASNEWNRFLRFRHTPPITSDDAKEKLLFVENKRSRMMQQMMGRIVLYVEGNINYARGFQTPEELVEYLQGGTLLKDIEEADNSSSDEEDEY